MKVNTHQKILSPKPWIFEPEGKLASKPPDQVIRGGLSELENQFREYGRKPSKELQEGFDYARAEIINLARQMGVPVPNQQDMDLVFLDEKHFFQIQKEFQKKVNKATPGFRIPFIHPIVMNADSINQFTTYESMATAYHEWIHRYFEYSVGVYDMHQESSDKGVQILFEPRRSGLVITKVRRDQTGNIISSCFIGSAINELGNNIYQKRFTEKLLKNAKWNTVFGREKHERQINIERLMGEKGKDEMCPVDGEIEGESYTFYIHRSNLHFDKRDDLLANDHVLSTQLADDLCKLCGSTSGIPFEELLLKAKFDPLYQRKMQEVLDAKVMPGFYHRLRNLNRSDITETHAILELVQKKLYPELFQSEFRIMRANPKTPEELQASIDWRLRRLQEESHKGYQTVETIVREIEIFRERQAELVGLSRISNPVMIENDIRRRRVKLFGLTNDPRDALKRKSLQVEIQALEQANKTQFRLRIAGPKTPQQLEAAISWRWKQLALARLHGKDPSYILWLRTEIGIMQERQKRLRGLEELKNQTQIKQGIASRKSELAKPIQSESDQYRRKALEVEIDILKKSPA